MNKESYRRYLRTPHWRNFKRRFYEKFEYRCIVCSARYGLHIHHLTYERLGHERLEDAVYLCGNCHSHLHAGDFSLSHVIFYYPRGKKVIALV